MVKIMKNKKSVKTRKAVKIVRRAPARSARMGPVTTIDTAPVAIGNSVRGASTVARATGNGIVVTGRDFMFSPIGSGAILTWTVCGGTPITPVAFADSAIRQYMQMYQKYRWKALVVHYITSSPTSSTGDVLFYHAKNRSSVFLSQTSSMLLPFVFSDPDTVLGPQWTNHSTQLNLQGTWKSTDYGMSDTVDDFADGELFLLSKTVSTEAPGYVMFDYQIEFSELQITPRLLALPLPRAQYFQSNIGAIAYAVTSSSPLVGVQTGNNISGNASTKPTGCVQGDIYKVFLDVTNSETTLWNNATINNLMAIENVTSTAAADSSFVPVDGTTCYAIYGSDNLFYFCSTATAAYAGNCDMRFNCGSVNVDYNLQVWFSLIGTRNTTNLNPNY